MKFPTLYKKTNSEAIQYWKVCVLETPNSGALYDIEIEYGQVETLSPQITIDIISKGKNIGRSNETTPYEQACAEAQSKWEKQKKKGYVESKEAAEAGEVDDLIEGGIVPMLAFTFEKQGHKIKYPAFTQPKLDGIRMIAIYQNGKCTLWSRTRKAITSLPHIVTEIESLLSTYPIAKNEAFIFDGEAYHHDFKTNFEHIVHLVRQETPDLQCTDVQYHIYDLVNDKTFKERNLQLVKILDSSGTKYLKRVETMLVVDEEDVMAEYMGYKENGYEGAILRNSAGLYVNKRSSDLIKVKEMQDDEFEIIGIEEGRGKLAGHVGAFVCRTRDGQEFKAKPAGATERLREYFCNHGLWQGRQLVVQYQSMTSYGLPRFPVGLRLKEEV